VIPGEFRRSFRQTLLGKHAQGLIAHPVVIGGPLNGPDRHDMQPSANTQCRTGAQDMPSWPICAPDCLAWKRHTTSTDSAFGLP
jgi:hypothetical protein